MENSEIDGPMPVSEADVRDACEQYKGAMFQVCRRMLPDKSDAEDALSQAVLNALSYPPGSIRIDLKFWLLAVARNAAKDLLRKKKNARSQLAAADSTTGDQFRQVQVVADVGRLLRQIKPFLDDTERADLSLYLEVVLRNTTEKQLADQLGISRQSLKSRRRKVRQAVRDAVTAVYLIGEPGEGTNRCLTPHALARGRAASPQLLKDVRTHAAKCKICRRKRDDTRALVGTFLAVTGLALTPSVLQRVVTAIPSKSFATAAVSTAAGLVVGVLVVRPEPAQLDPGWAAPPPLTSEPAISTTQPDTLPGRTGSPIAPGTPGASDGTVRTPDDPHLADPSPAALPTPIPPDLPPPRADDQVRDDRPPSISRPTLDHTRIAATNHGTCAGGQPTTARVEATVTAPSGVTSVTLRLRVRDTVTELPITHTEGTSTWYTVLGPFPAEVAGTQMDLSVRAVGTNGAEAIEPIGTVCITPCGSHHVTSSDPQQPAP
jgi:RNA polymerase sigma factor (sigma-70 family)